MEDQHPSDNNAEHLILPVVRTPTIFESNLLYFTVLIGMIVFGGIAYAFLDMERIGTSSFLLLLALITAVVIGLPILIYIVSKNVDYKSIFRFKSIDRGELLLVGGLAFLGYPVITALNLVWHWLISHIGTPVVPELPSITTLTEFLLAVIVIGVFPSFFEEILFRGIMLKGYERLGKYAAIIATGVLFGMLHKSFANFPALILLGILLGYIVYRSDSVYSGMLYHFIHNTIAVTFLFFAGIAQQYIEESALTQPQMSDEQMLFFGRIIWIVLGVISAGGFVACLAAFIKKTKNKTQHAVVDEERPLNLYVQMLPALGGGLIIVLMLALEVFTMITSS